MRKCVMAPLMTAPPEAVAQLGRLVIATTYSELKSRGAAIESPPPPHGGSWVYVTVYRLQLPCGHDVLAATWLLRESLLQEPTP